MCFRGSSPPSRLYGRWSGDWFSGLTGVHCSLAGGDHIPPSARNQDVSPGGQSRLNAGGL